MELSAKDRAALKAQAQEIPAALQLGKSGITDAFASEVAARLKRERLLKIKFLKSAKGAHEVADMARELAERTGAALVETRGGTVVLYRPKRRGKASPSSAVEVTDPEANAPDDDAA
ncbi:MAG: YhbY family RNA-binding protein [Thermoplasmatota archaeon]